MILGSSECNATQKQKEINTKEFFSIIDNKTLSEDQTARLFYLIQDGINVNDRNKSGCTPLLMSVRCGNQSLVQRLIQLGANFNMGILDPIELHEAVWRGNCEIARILIKGGANINASDDLGLTALHYVTEEHKTEMVELLLSLGANADLKDVNGRTPLHTVAMYGFTDIARLLLNSNADIDAIDNDGNTPLHLTLIGYKDTEVAKLLLDKGADSTIKNRVDKTPLQEALDETLSSYFFDPAWFSERLNDFFKNILLLYIMKFVEADDWRFEHLRETLGEGFSSVQTADDMVAQILAEPNEQIKVIVEIIDKLYPNAAKMAPPSLVSRLLDAIDYSFVQECASSSSHVCTDDEQPPVMMVTSVRKRDQRESDSENKNKEKTKRCRI